MKTETTIKLSEINKFILSLKLEDLKNYENLEELKILLSNIKDIFGLIKYPNYYKIKLLEKQNGKM